MTGFFKALIEKITPCSHKWEEERRSTIVRIFDKQPIGQSSYCKCEKCGERRVFRMKGVWND